jgi:anti-sigma factor ChrR (cupin superfamily)
MGVIPMQFDCRDINTDLGSVAIVDTGHAEWQPSPSGTVWRKPLFRRGGEHGPVTSVVRYAAGGSFAPHSHPDGEEILVIEGVFSDEGGDYPAGTYMLNPDGSRHAPRSDHGCVLFVRLRQCPGADRPRLCLNTAELDWQQGPAPGVQAKTLFAAPAFPDRMMLWRLDPSALISAVDGAGGAEIFVLEGTLETPGGDYGPGCWLRYPVGTTLTLGSEKGCLIYVRLGGLAGVG